VERTFVDTNVVVYADDLDAGEKRIKARQLVGDLLRTACGVLSTQVLQEFFVVATRKLSVDASVARRKVELLARMEVVRVDERLVLEAIDLHRLHALSFWDALIVRAAAVGGCARILSEDMHHGRTIDGVRIENPFTGGPIDEL
jgi:predicted nucleic acid-binding protein